MAHTPKSKYVGNHGGAYTDMDNMSRQFTYVDHDRNTTRLTSWNYDRKKDEKTNLQLLAEAIVREGINELPSFIEFYDNVLAKKYEFERYRKGLPVNVMQIDTPWKGEEWVADLRTLYESETRLKVRKK